MWEAFEHAAFDGLDNLTAIIDVNRLGQRGETMHGWDLDSYAERAPRPSAGTPSRSTATTSPPSTQAYAEAEATTGQPTVIVARTDQGQGRGRGREQERLARQAARRSRGGHRASSAGSAISTVEVAEARTTASLHRFAGSGRRSSCRATRSATQVATRKAYGDALAALGARRGRRGRPRRRGRELDPRRALRARPTPTATSRCTSPSSRWWPPPSACRCAAGSRSPRPSPRSSAAPTTSCAWRPSAGRTSACAARTPACPSARTGRRRWRSRTWPRSGPSTASTVLYPCDANQTARLVAAMADRDGISYLRTTRGKTAVSTGPDETFPIGGSRVVRSSDDDRRHHRRRRHHPARGARGRRRAGRRGHHAPASSTCYSVKPIDAATLRAAAEATGGRSSPSRTTGRRAGSATPCSSALADADERPRVRQARGPRDADSGTPDELLSAAGIDADHIAAAARRLVESGVRA